MEARGMSSPRDRTVRAAYRAGLSIVTAVDAMASRVGWSSAFSTRRARAMISSDSALRPVTSIRFC